MNSIKKFSKALCLLLTMMLLFSFVTLAEQEAPIKVMIDGKQVEFDEQPMVVEGAIMIPLRAVFQKMGAQVLWDPFFGRVMIKLNENDSIVMYASDMEFYKNNVKLPTADKAFFHENRTYVPADLIGKCIDDISVEWSAKDKRVDIVPKYKAMKIVPYGEFLSIPAPVSVNSKFTVLDYVKENGIATVKFALNGESLYDFERYSTLMEAVGYENIKELGEDNLAIYYGKGAVIKLEISEDGETFSTSIYEDAEGETVKEYINQ